jgi:hypothetical protein
MSLEIREWPPGAFEQSTLIARSLLEGSNMNRPKAREHLVTLIARIILQGAPDDADALADQVLAQPELIETVRLSKTQRALLEACDSGKYAYPFDVFVEVFGDRPSELSVGALRFRDTVDRARAGGTVVGIHGDYESPHGSYFLEVYDDQRNPSSDTRVVLEALLPYV